MTTLLEKVLAQVSQLPDTEQDAVAARLLQTLTDFEQEKQQITPKPRPQFGSAKGMFTLAPDFEAPITDFQVPYETPCHHAFNKPCPNFPNCRSGSRMQSPA